MVNEQLECVDQYAPRCLDKERIELVKTQTLQALKNYVDENPTLFGDKFIEICPAMQGISKAYARSNFGTDECSDDEVQNLKNERDVCQKKAEKEFSIANINGISKLEDFSSYSNFMLPATCQFKKDYLKCYDDTVFKCTSQEVREEVLKLEDEEFSIYEKEILKTFDFKFEKCSTY